MLILPPWTFAYCTDNQPSTPSASSQGTQVQTDGTPTPNVDGTPVTLLSALAHDVHRLCIHVTTTGASTFDTATLLDILADPAGGTSWASFIDDLTAGFLAADTTVNNAGLSAAAFFDFPVFIPAGTSLGAQARTAYSVQRSLRVSVWAFGEPSRPEMWWCGQGVETLGANPGSSKGTNVTPGNTGSWGSWVSIGSPIARRYGAIQLGLGGTDSGASGQSYHFEIGFDSAAIPGLPLQCVQMGAAEQFAYYRPGGPIFCDVPAGKQMQVRGKASGTAEVWDTILYGVY